MILRNALIEPKLIEQTPLLATSAHHLKPFSTASVNRAECAGVLQQRMFSWL
jgi:hypothetical protein